MQGQLGTHCAACAQLHSNIVRFIPAQVEMNLSTSFSSQHLSISASQHLSLSSGSTNFFGRIPRIPSYISVLTLYSCVICRGRTIPIKNKGASKSTQPYVYHVNQFVEDVSFHDLTDGENVFFRHSL
jgi:hypothetical protein